LTVARETASRIMLADKIRDELIRKIAGRQNRR
jgi:hypothetical protein